MPKTYTVIGFAGDEAIDLYHNLEEAESAFGPSNASLIDQEKVFTRNFDSLSERSAYFEGMKDARKHNGEPMEFSLKTYGEDLPTDEETKIQSFSDAITDEMHSGNCKEMPTEADIILFVLGGKATSTERAFYNSRFGEDHDKALEKLISVQTEAFKEILEKEYRAKFNL